MDDEEVRARIERLEDEERALRADEASQADQGHGRAVRADAERLAAIKIELDQLWDLLRQRRAKRAAGEDPDRASLRDAGTVEGYLG